jgi:hypothetical protein
MVAPTSKKPTAGKRNNFVRTNIPMSENVASVIILLLLVGIGVAIGVKGRHFNPNIFTVRTGSLDATAATVDGKSQTVSAATEMEASDNKKTSTAQTVAAQDKTPEGETSSPAVPTTSTPAADAQGGGEGEGGDPPPAAKGDPLEITMEGIKPMSPTEFYNSDTLYEKIDGRSPAYQSFHIQKLRCRTFSVVAEPGSFVDVYEYGFDSPVDAFGMFSLERDPNGKPLDFASDGYSGEMGWFFRQGTVYVQIIASDQKPATLALGKAIAQNRAKTLPADDSGLAGRRKLPSTGMIADSVSFIAENAQGQSGLKEVFQAKYKFEGAEIPFFIMATTPDAAVAAWKSFETFCGRFGKTELLPDVNGGKIFAAQLFGKWKVVYQREGELGGVFDATDSTKAKSFVEKYLKGEIK